jgi:hypothetical protein
MRLYAGPNGDAIDVCPDTGRAIAPVVHDLRITERVDAAGVVTYDWTCTGCAYAFGFHLATEDECRAAAAHHVTPSTRHLSNAERRERPQFQILKGDR